MRLLLSFAPLPRIVTEPPSYPLVIQVDGFYLEYPSLKVNRHLPGAKMKASLLLWALDARTGTPLAWRYYDSIEDPASWKDFVKYMKEELNINPSYVVYDGAMGARMAFTRYYPDCISQRCLVHIRSNMNKDLGIAPRTGLAKEVKRLGMMAASIKTHEDLEVWAELWEALCIEHSDKFRALHEGPVEGIPRVVHSAFSVVNNAYRSGELTTFLDHSEVPSNTNLIESYNGNLREILSRHRGMELDKRKNLLSWYLALKHYTTEELMEMARKHTF
jgi:Transposase, Mutator family